MQTALVTEPLLNADQVAELLGVTPGAVQHMHRMRTLPASLVAGKLRWHPTTVRAYLASLAIDVSSRVAVTIC